MTQVLRAEDFPPLRTGWGTPVEREVRRRIQLSVATYGYEIADKPIMADCLWDWLAGRINKTMGTCHPLVDEFFAAEFSPMTGMWIHHHPELDGIKQLYERYYALIGADQWENLRRRSTT